MALNTALVNQIHSGYSKKKIIQQKKMQNLCLIICSMYNSLISLLFETEQTTLLLE